MVCFFVQCPVCVCVGVCVWLNARCCIVCFSVFCVHVGVSLVRCALLHGLFFLCVLSIAMLVRVFG